MKSPEICSGQAGSGRGPRAKVGDQRPAQRLACRERTVSLTWPFSSPRGSRGLDEACPPWEGPATPLNPLTHMLTSFRLAFGDSPGNAVTPAAQSR